MPGFPLLAEPPPSVAAVGDADLAPLEGEISLGFGLVTPFRRDRRADFAASGSYALVRSALSQVLGVRADDGRMTGELPWRPEFGSLLHHLQHMNTDESFSALARSRVIGAVARWEPRARIANTSIRRMKNAQGELVVLLRVAFDLVQVGTGSVLARNLHVDMPLGS